MIPNNLWSDNQDIKGYMLYGLDKPAYVSTNKHFQCVGPIDVSTEVENPAAAWWLSEYVDGTIKLFKYTGSAYEYHSDLLAVVSCVQLSLAFDQIGKPLVFFNTGTELRLWWYDPVLEEHTTTVFGVGASPFTTLDVKYERNTEYSDVLLFYIRDGAIYYRVQRDRYTVEYATPVTSGARILMVDMAVDYRLQLLWR